MTIFRSMDRGSWIVKRRVLDLRIRKATGIEDREQALEFERVLRKLGTHGRRDLIEAFLADTISGSELLAGVEQYGITFQLTVQSSIRLRRAMWEWLRDVDLAEKTRNDYRWNLGPLVGKLPPLNREPTSAEERALHQGPVLRDLADLLTRHAKKVSPAMFTQVQAACQSYVRATVPRGEHSELWAAIASIKGPKAKERDVLGGLTPERAREAAELLAATYDAVTGQVWWMLCCTGMEPKECWREGGWRAELDRIQVRGTKTKKGYRVRWVPRIVTPVRPAVGLRTFRKRLKAVGERMGLSKTLKPYVARRTFAHWLELAKKEGQILDSQCDLLLGQSPKTDRQKYREHDIIPYLPAIAAALRKVIGTDPVYLRAMA